MATDWYLLKSPHSQLSGYESDAIDDFAEEGFEEALDSSIAVDIKLYNYDLSQCINTKAIIQNNVQDTKLKSLNRMLFVPIGTCKAGMYVKYKNRFWLIVGLVDNNTMYEKAIMVICNYLLSWFNKDGNIVQRWVNVVSASQYNNGETGSRFYTIRSDQLLISAPDDDECMLLDAGKKFIIDRRCAVYEKNFDNLVVYNTDNPVCVYELTRSDSVIYNYQDSGHSEFMVSQKEQGEQDGYYVYNNKGYWLCDIPNDVSQPNVSSSTPLVSNCLIECESNEIYDGLDAGVFVAKFYNNNGQVINVNPIWEIICDFENELSLEYVGNSIMISVDNSKLINKTFILSLSAEGYEPVTITIAIKAFL